MPEDTFLRLGVARNNLRAMRSKYNFPKLIFVRSIPTAATYREEIVLPKSAAMYDVKYLMFSYPVTAGVYREIFFDLFDSTGRGFVKVDLKSPDTSFGAKGTLFSSPGVDTTPAAAGDTSVYLGMFPINESFPGLSVLNFVIRGATAAPNPSFIDLLLVGRVHAKGAPNDF